MHQMAFVYDLLFQSKIVSGFTEQENTNKNENEKNMLCVYLQPFSLTQCLALIPLFPSISLHEITKVNNQPREKNIAQSYHEHVQQTRMTCWFFDYIIFILFSKFQFFRMRNHTTAFVYCL